MTLAIGRNINKYNNPLLTSGIMLNPDTSTKILDVNPNRIGYRISNTSSKDVWIKEQAASVDNAKKGDIVWKRSTGTSEVDNIYTGEISAIAVSGNPIIFVVGVEA